MMQIEGLRAVAALLVAVFHIWIGRVSGSVDVFFVVAGYLITTTLLGHYAKFGRVRARYYLGRLARRLLPASLVVLAVVAAATFVFLPSNVWLPTMRQILASALYSENWLLAAESIDYLAKDAFHSPVQNFWAMSVQGQFYIIWLVVFAVIGLVTVAARNRTKTVLVTLLALFGVSLIYSVISTNTDQAFAYYSTFARVWEFALGGIGAIIIPKLRIPQMLRSVLGWIGLLGVLTCGFLLQVSQVFPGYAALWPTLSALLVIVGGTGGGPFTAGRLLATRPLVWLGGISYGIYLWHWPILIFVLQHRKGETPSLEWGVLIIGAAIVLAWLTKLFVEDPIIRRSQAATPRARRVATVVPVAALVVVVMGSSSLIGITQAKLDADQAYADTITSGAVPCLGAASTAAPCVNDDLPSPPIPLDPREDNAEPNDYRCRTDPDDTDLKKCTYGPEDADTSVVLIGNSHAINWFPALQSLTEDRGWKLDVYFKAACAFNTTDRSGPADEVESCRVWNEKLENELARLPAYDYMLSSYSAGGEQFVNAEGQVDPDLGVVGFREAWEPLLDRGTTVWAMQDTPLLPQTAYDCYLRNLENSESCGTVAAADVFQSRDLIVEAATDLPGAEAINMNQYFCPDDECVLSAGGVNIYRDTSHFTSTWSLTLAPYLEEKLKLSTFG
jgi:peptidoglycan/LPS O-acetylase OafA/YrhL